MLRLIDRLLETWPTLEILLTTGTVASARLLETRLPARVRHQYVPIDLPNWIGRFLDHWRPDLALWVESELWPNLVLATHARQIPMMLVNGRLSARSYRRWRRWPGLIGPMLGAFAQCLAQDADQAERLRRLGARDVAAVGDLKAAGATLPVDQAQLWRLRQQIGVAPDVARGQHSCRRGGDRRGSPSPAGRRSPRLADDNRAPPSSARRRRCRDAHRLRAERRSAQPWRCNRWRHRNLPRRHDRRTRPVLPSRRDRLYRRVADAKGRAQPVRSRSPRLRGFAWAGYEQLRRDGFGARGSRSCGNRDLRRRTERAP